MGWISLQSKGLSRVLQHHNSKAPILQYSAFFMVQLSNPYMTTGKNIALTIQTFNSKVVSLLFKMLSRFVIAFLPRTKHLLILCNFNFHAWSKDKLDFVKLCHSHTHTHIYFIKVYIAQSQMQTILSHESHS